jgi:hypothetical protein
VTAPSISSLSPPVEVSPPEFTPYRYGLLSVTQVADGGGRWELGGISYTTPKCPQRTSEWATLCPIVPPGPVVEKNIPTGLDQVSAKPFTLYDGVGCYPQSGRTDQELLQISEQNLIAGEQEKVEEKFWEALRARATVVAPAAPAPATNPWGLCSGLGVIEQLIAQMYGGVGVVHAPRPLITSMKTKQMAYQREGETDRLLTPADNIWAFGAGYNLNGPPLEDDEDNTAPAGTAWLYATGPVMLRRSEVLNHSAFDIPSNEKRALSERNYVITAECPSLAVLIQVPEC